MSGGPVQWVQCIMGNGHMWTPFPLWTDRRLKTHTIKKINLRQLRWRAVKSSVIPGLVPMDFSFARKPFQVMFKTFSCKEHPLQMSYLLCLFWQ